MKDWLKRHRFGVQLAALAIFILAPVGMFLAATADESGLIWVMIGFYAAACGLILI